MRKPFEPLVGDAFLRMNCGVIPGEKDTLDRCAEIANAAIEFDRKVYLDLYDEANKLRAELKAAREVILIIARPPCPYLLERERCGQCSTCLARAFLNKQKEG